MRISVSNIAWDIAEEQAIAALLAERGIDLVDIAPGKYLADPEAATDAEIESVRRLWADRGFAIHGMQGLLFGTTGLNLFDDPDGRMGRRLAAICRIGGLLGAKALTFGSPRQRDRGGLADRDAEAIAVAFFRQLGEAAREAGVLVCLEPNPAYYGCNFMVGTDEAAAIVAAVDHPAIRLQFDTGSVAMNGEAAADLIERHARAIGHVHASEPKLATLGDGGAPHAEAAAALRAHRPDLVVTVEMVAAAAPHAGEVARAVDLALRHYGGRD
jgi:sugar phosphate isomerase/epimerase